MEHLPQIGWQRSVQKLPVAMFCTTWCPCKIRSIASSWDIDHEIYCKICAILQSFLVRPQSLGKWPPVLCQHQQPCRMVGGHVGLKMHSQGDENRWETFLGASLAHVKTLGKYSRETKAFKPPQSSNIFYIPVQNNAELEQSRSMPERNTLFKWKNLASSQNCFWKLKFSGYLTSWS